MNMSVRAKETIDACRFCWMCRHICPVGRATGQERNTARARALALSMVERGAEKLSSVAENLYECALCNACTHDCLTGWEPPAFTLEARREAALTGAMPAAIGDLVRRCMEWGNPFAPALPEETAKALREEERPSDTLLYLGESARYKSVASVRQALAVMKKSGAGFTVLAEEPSSGYALHFLTGDTEETVAQYKKCAQVLGQFKKIVVADGNDLLVMRRYYREAGVETAAETVSLWRFLSEQAGGRLRRGMQGAFTLQESCALARDLEEDDAHALAAALGEPAEMLLHGKECVFAGSLLMNEYIPETMACVAARRLEDAARAGAERVLVCDPSEYELMRANNAHGIEIVGLAEAVLEALS